jgi:hypothetical protein
LNDIIINILGKMIIVILICANVAAVIFALRVWNKSINESKDNRVIVVMEDGKAIVYENVEVYIGGEKAN